MLEAQQQRRGMSAENISEGGIGGREGSWLPRRYASVGSFRAYTFLLRGLQNQLPLFSYLAPHLAALARGDALVRVAHALDDVRPFERGAQVDITNSSAGCQKGRR